MTFLVNYVLCFIKLVLMLSFGLVSINGFNSTIDNNQKLFTVLILAGWCMIGVVFGMITKYYINNTLNKRRLKSVSKFILGLILGFAIGWIMIQFLESIKLGFEYIKVQGQPGLIQNLIVWTLFGTHLYDQERVFRY